MKIEYVFMIVGVGGTGGNFAKEFIRFITNLSNNDITVKIIFIDGDVIEEKNCSRQPYISDDINLKKAAVLAEAVGDTFGFDVTAYTEYIVNCEQLRRIYRNLCDVSSLSIPVIIGCVDNHRCRQVLHEYFNLLNNCIYFDSANEFSVGEVVFASKLQGKVVSPPRAYYYHDVLTDTSPNKEEESCQATNKAAPQHLVTNMFAANILLTACAELLTSGKVMNGIVYFDSFRYFARHHEYVGEVENSDKC